MAEQQAAEAARKRALRRNGGIAAAAAAVVAVVIALAALGGSGNSSASPLLSSAVPPQIDQQLAGIPEAGTRLGNPNAPVTITEYVDLECAATRQLILGAEVPLIANDVRSGRVQLRFASMETATREPSVFQTQQVAALAAGRQQRLWYYIELFYHQQGTEGTSYVTEGYLDGLARQVPGLDYNGWLNDRQNASLPAQLQADAADATKQGLTATPALVVQGPKGTAQPLIGVPSYGTIEQAIQSVA